MLEPERRKYMINRCHGLLQIAMDRLYYQDNERPSSEELYQRLTGLRLESTERV